MDRGFNLDTEKGRADALTYFLELSSDESIPESASEVESDFLVESDHETDSDQDAESFASSSDDDIPLSDLVLRWSLYTGRDKITKWKKIENAERGRPKVHNIIKKKSGPKDIVKNLRNSLQIWNLLITPEMISSIVNCTNIYIGKMTERYTRPRDCLPTNASEIRALFGLLYIAGVQRSSHLNARELWTKDGTGVEIYGAVMSINRFQFLLKCLRFDNVHTRKERKDLDRLAAIRDIFEQFVNNCQKLYNLGSNVTIDEKLEAFRGRCAFRQYIKSKPARYGVKIFALSDSETYYTYNLEIYAGQQPDGPFRISNSPPDVVKRLINPITGSGRNITMDNWFTSLPLATELLEKNKLTIVGTIRKNKKEIPPEFLDTKNRGPKTTLFGFQKNITLLSHVPKKGKVVLMLSTKHNDSKIDEVSKKPDMICFYNQTKGGVDTVDQMCSTYSVSRKSNRWPLTVFFAVLNVTGINAQIIYNANAGDNKIMRRHFLKSLGLELIQEHLVYRSTLLSLPRDIKMQIKKFSHVGSSTEGETTNEETNPRKPYGSTGRCQICPYKKDRKSKTRCVKCQSFICKEHTVPLCTLCSVPPDANEELED